jgi:5-methylcytosine-specific restriction endonuclease McrA
MKRYSKKVLEEITRSSNCLYDVCKKLGLCAGGDMYDVLRRDLSDWKISTQHFDGERERYRKIKQAMVRGQKNPRTVEDVLRKNSGASPTLVKKWAQKAIRYECECGITTNWRGKTISLQLDHIDGNRENHEVSNLRWLCPNCHSQTGTWGTRRNRKPRPSEIDPEWKTKDKPSLRKVPRPSKEELKELLDLHKNFSYIGRQFGVSDNTIRKWARRYELI